MPSSDIYQVKESPWAKKEETPSAPKRRRRRSSETFDEAVNKDVSQTHRRRRKNSGFRRFLHLMKKPEFSKRFWITAVSISGVILIILLVWDVFFRYPDREAEYSGDAYEYEGE